MLLMNMWRATVDDAPAKQLVMNWNHDANSLQFWRASSNFVYRFEADGGRSFWLRFIHEADNTIANIEAELHYIEYLIAKGYAAAAPVLSLNGRFVETIESEQGRYYGVVFEQAAGVRVQVSGVTEDQLGRWGQSLAQLHLLAEDYQPPLGTKVRRSWEDILRFISGVLERHPNEEAAVAELNRVEQWLLTLPSEEGHTGLIHYDFQLDNVFDMGEREAYSVIDFDDAMYHWYAMDIAAALADLDDLDEAEAVHARTLFLQGYQVLRPLDELLMSELPRFRCFAKLYSFARLLRCIEGLEPANAPEWLIGLHQKVLTWCSQMREGFER
ncbi:Ser/Thr protein kinase RdoA involved in Cpx stress response, MazF antagonist [Paenibacillus sp. OV219]|nr:Ser/Thr protein kinase RdoA involved in Cpx stress response, MazF antagonist [Paenibacillus sp. OV219]